MWVSSVGLIGLDPGTPAGLEGLTLALLYRLTGPAATGPTVGGGRGSYARPEGRLFIAMLGAFAQYYSDSLAKHTSKGRRERFLSGLPNGDIPFGYSVNGDGVPVPVAEEASAVRQVFERYATGGYSLEQLASCLNDTAFFCGQKL